MCSLVIWTISIHICIVVWGDIFSNMSLTLLMPSTDSIYLKSWQMEPTPAPCDLYEGWVCMLVCCCRSVYGILSYNFVCLTHLAISLYVKFLLTLVMV